MALTTDQMQQIATDLMNGREASITGQEADDFRQSLAADIALARQNGWEIEIPSEWEVGGPELVKKKPGSEE